MRDHEYKQKLNEEIKKRMESSGWNYQIAAKVLESKKRSRKRIFYLSYISSFSFAATMVILFMFGIWNKPQENIYEQFITKQIEGTYNSILDNKSDSSVAGNNDKYYILTGEIDNIINETLSMR